MATLTSSTCGKNSAFVVSGVSGGATGLAVMNSTPTPLRAVDEMTHERALGVGIDGLLSRDLLAGVFGVNVRPIGASADDKYPDRGALMEQAWEHDVSGSTGGGTKLAEPFPIAAHAAPSWKTVFNGTSVANGCRVLVTDIDLGAGAKGCSDFGNPVPGSYDLLGRYPCYSGIALSTAQLLAARFPYVTPSGVIRACDDEDKPGSFQDQIIDGGYSENSGIDTLNGLLGSVLPTVQAANAKAVNDDPQDPVIVVPMVVFLHNTPSGPAPLAKKKTEKPEVLVPPTSGLSGNGILGATSTLLQRAQALTANIFPAGSTTAARYSWLTSDAHAFPLRAMTVGPQVTPQVGLPLGWAMSQETITSMKDALNKYLSCPDGASKPTDPCTQAVRFNTLLDLMSVKRCFAGVNRDGELADCDAKSP